ncbi:MAG: hypothetical protein JXJ20_14705 [Anaerolineae bacterium]|nr:hypothetical protein [Anaerolineae bacterium]
MSSSRARAQSWPYPRQRRFEHYMRQIAANWFAERGVCTHARYPYILAQYDDWAHNIILPKVAEYIQTERAERKSHNQGFPLHRYIHHGLSSQAMVFNLIGPLIVYNDLEPLATALAQHNVAWPHNDIIACFEYEDRSVFNEDTGQPTSLDVVFADQHSAPFLFMEAKFVEKEFGGCSVFAQGDCDGRNPASDFSTCYLHHLGRRYWELLEKHGFLSGPLGQNTTCILATYYQFFREMLFALELDSTLVLLADARNPTFYCDSPKGERGLVPFLLSLIPATVQNRFVFLTIQQLVTVIRQTRRHKWIAEFERKYGLD